MSKVAVKIDSVFDWNNDYTQMLIMQTQDGDMSFPIIISNLEVNGLVKELEQFDIERPQTHDLFFSLMQSFDIRLEEVYIHDFEEGIFLTKLTCSTRGRTIELDSRPSDAIVLALKAKAPIFVKDSILRKVGTSTIEMSKRICRIGDFSRISRKLQFTGNPSTLEDLLEQAIKMENFEMAAQIRDMLKQKKD